MSAFIQEHGLLFGWLTVIGQILLFTVVLLLSLAFLLLMDRINAGRDTSDPVAKGATGFQTFVAIFGVIAIIVGIQGLFTPN